MLNLLNFLIEHFADFHACPMPEDLGMILENEGFTEDEIGKTLFFMSLFAEMSNEPLIAQIPPTMRVYSADELAMLSPEIRGFLHHWHKENALSAIQREYIIHALMHLPEDEISLETAKMLAILVLWANRSEMPLTLSQEYLSAMRDQATIH